MTLCYWDWHGTTLINDNWIIIDLAVITAKSPFFFMYEQKPYLVWVLYPWQSFLLYCEYCLIWKPVYVIHQGCSQGKAEQAFLTNCILKIISPHFCFAKQFEPMMRSFWLLTCISNQCEMWKRVFFCQQWIKWAFESKLLPSKRYVFFTINTQRASGFIIHKPWLAMSFMMSLFCHVF